MADLLKLWRPGGDQRGGAGLRLAVRDNYLNFYRRGQSVARVSLDRRGDIQARTHVKYVVPSASGQGYVSLNQDGEMTLGSPSRKASRWRYGSQSSVRDWIAAIDGDAPGPGVGYAGPEKDLVDQLVAENPDVIDLEMGLPAWGARRTAPRMDLVAIERTPVGASIVFWEAKRVMDGRIRCRGQVRPDVRPHVLKQLADYREFLAVPEHRIAVISAYRQAATILGDLASLAHSLGNPIVLGEAIQDAANSKKPLDVDPQPRLVVFNCKSANQSAWAHHHHRLVSEGNIYTLVLEENGPHLLRPPSPNADRGIYG